MATDVIVAPSAEKDIDDILDYLVAESPPAARQFLDRIEHASVRLGEHPFLGPASQRPQREGLRKLSLEPYVVFYRVTLERVEIIRVLHAARNLDDEQLFDQ